MHSIYDVIIKMHRIFAFCELSYSFKDEDYNKIRRSETLNHSINAYYDIIFLEKIQGDIVIDGAKELYAEIIKKMN